MNKIYNAFSNIKVNDELKEKAYQRIITKDYHSKNKQFNFLRFSLATSIILCIFLYNYSDKTKNSNYPEDHIMSTESIGYEENSIMYNNNYYIIDNDTKIEENMLNKKLQFQTQDDSMEIYTTDSNSTTFYSIKNIDDLSKIAVLNNGSIIVYKIDDKTNR